MEISGQLHDPAASPPGKEPLAKERYNSWAVVNTVMILRVP
jgi:hypothetical protein